MSGDRIRDADRVLQLLEAKPGEWIGELYRATGVMVHSRVADLRRRGYVIESKRFGPND